MANLHIIVIEGTDGCGKQTQATILCDKLNEIGLKALKMSFPNYESSSSGAVKMYLGGELCERADDFDAYQSSILFTVDRLCTMTKLQKDLTEQSGDVFLICDRYVESNLLFQASKLDGKDKDKFADWLYGLEYDTVKLPRPEMIVFLNMPIEVSQKLAHFRTELKAGTKKDIHEQDDEYMRRCYNTGIHFANKNNWHIIDCAKENEPKSIADISKTIFDSVKNRFEILERENGI